MPRYTPPTNDLLSARIGVVESSQAGGLVGAQTLAALNAALNYPVNTLARVVADSTTANNGDYIKLGASGTGSWQLNPASRTTALETRATSVEGRTSTLESGTFGPFSMTNYPNGLTVGGVTLAYLLMDSANSVTAGIDFAGKWYFFGDAAVSGLLTVLAGANISGPVTLSGLVSFVQTLNLSALTVAGATAQDSLPGKPWVLMDSQNNIAAEVDLTGSMKLYGPYPRVGRLEQIDPTAYVTDVAWGVTDEAGNLPLYLDSQGRLNAPGGVVAPNTIPNGITIDTDGSVRVNNTLAVSKSLLRFDGDSLTFGTGSTTGNDMPSQVSALLGGRTFYTHGLPGANSVTIAARINAQLTLVTLSGNAIPATTAAVQVTAITPALSSGSATDVNVFATLAGVPGVLFKDNGSPSGYSFYRSTAGSSVTVPARTPITFPSAGREEWTQVIWVGRNDGPTMGADTVANARAIRDSMPVGVRRFVVLSVLNAVGEGTGMAAYTTVMNTNALLKAALPHNYIDVRSVLAAGTSDDVPAAAYRSDNVHLNDTGYNIVAQEVTKFLNWKGW